MGEYLNDSVVADASNGYRSGSSQVHRSKQKVAVLIPAEAIEALDESKHRPIRPNGGSVFVDGVVGVNRIS